MTAILGHVHAQPLGTVVEGVEELLVVAAHRLAVADRQKERDVVPCIKLD
jgi:hypothetical protein